MVRTNLSHQLASLLFCGMSGAFLFCSEPLLSRALAQGKEGKEVSIERMPVILRDHSSFQTPLYLEPEKMTPISAQSDGILNSVAVKRGQKIAAQSEILRFETDDQQLLVKRAEAALEEAKAMQETSPGKVSDAHLKVAKIDLEITKRKLEAMTIRTPLTGMVFRMNVVPGQFVRAGEHLMTIADTSVLRVELPIDGGLKQGQPVNFKVENQDVTGKLESILPLTERFNSLRNLFVSARVGVVSVDNSTNRFQPGDTVYSEMIPRFPVVEAPSGAVSSGGDGERKVQVIRDGFVRDVKVQLLGSSGVDYVYVSGRFAASDELVVKSSQDLLEGARVVPKTAVNFTKPSSGDKMPSGKESPTSGTPKPAPTPKPDKPDGF